MLYRREITPACAFGFAGFIHIERPEMTAEIMIAEPLAEALAKKGYEALTPVQEAVLELSLIHI